MTNINKPMYIAEIGVNHSGELNCALNHITRAAKIGFNAVKFQFIDICKIWHEDCDKKFKLSNKEEFPVDWFQPIRKHCDLLGIEVGYTPTFQGASKIIKNHKSDFIKVASPQSEFDKFILDEAINTGLKLIISNGYSDLRSTKDLLKYLFSKKVDAGMLYCVAAYPADNIKFPYDEAFAIQKECKFYGIEFGLSDHYKSIYPALTLARHGASIFEKHFILDNIESMDKEVSSGVSESEQYIKQLNINSKDAKYIRKITLKDKQNIFSSSFYLKKNVQKGDKVYLKDFIRQRDCKGLTHNTFDLWNYFKENKSLKYFKRDKKKGDRINDGDLYTDD